MDFQPHKPPKREAARMAGDQPVTRTKLPLAVEAIVFGLILVCAFLLGLSILTQGHGWGDDFAAYLMQAQAIVDGKVGEFVYRNTFTIENSKPGLGPIVYPWGYPLALSPLVGVLGLNLVAIKLLNLCLYGLFLVAAYFLFRNRLGFLETSLVVAVFAVHPIMLNAINDILSDLLFLFLSTLCMLLIDRWITAGFTSMNWLRGFLLGLAIFAATQVRTTGFLLLLVLLVSQAVEGVVFYRKQKRGDKELLFIQAIPYLLLGVLWLLFSLMLPNGGESYAGQVSLKDIYWTVYNNLVFYGTDLLPSFLDALPYTRLVYILALLLSILGVVVTLRRDYAFAVYISATAMVYLIWPYTQGLRFLFPLLPFWIYVILRGIQWLLDRLVGRRVNSPRSELITRTLPVVGLLVVMAFFFKATLQTARTNLENSRQTSGPFSPESDALFGFIDENTSPGSVIGFFKPRAMRLLTGRDSFTLTRCQQLAQADYFAVQKFKKLESYNQISSNDLVECQLEGVDLELIFDQSRFSIYRIIKTP